jgi:tRNA 2-selenouridine synthase
LPPEIQIQKFLEYSSGIPIIDVRSPAEFEHAHINGAINIPLFDNQERALIGTLYKKKGQSEAILTGFEIAGKKIKPIAEEGLKAAKSGTLLIHCWRGGMRSESMAWIFNKIGITTYTLKGGYKSYRNYIRKYFSKKFKIYVLGGLTGSGKTEILCKLENAGKQVINLEKIAHHKGSVFGFLGNQHQNSNEQFENDLFESLYLLNPLKAIWIEDESRNIGRNIIPTEFFKAMNKSPMIIIEIGKELRTKRLVEEYGKFSNEELISCLNKISRRLGGLNTQLSIKALNEGKPDLTASIVLDYYDKTYRYSLSEKKIKNILVVPSKTADPDKNASLIIAAAQKSKQFQFIE